jgi:hypothetical protein
MGIFSMATRRKNFSRAWILLAVTSLTVASFAGPAWSDTSTVGSTVTTPGSEPGYQAVTWRPVQITLHSTRSYQNPYLDVDLTATFSGPNGRVMTMPGFWDGGNTWRIRFAPPVPGTWQFTTSATDPANAGLNAQHGTIHAQAYGGQLAVYRHGFLYPSRNDRYLTYADGTPFYWLGDTEWDALIGQVRLHESNDPRFQSEFKGIIDTRAAQGFTVIQTETFANNDETSNYPQNEGGPAWFSGSAGFFRDLNPKFWQNVDERISYIADKGLVTAMTMGVGRSLKPGQESLLPNYYRLARYIVARYAAYPVAWLTAQEYTLNACGTCWANIAHYFWAIDPYHRATSLHNQTTNPIAYHDQPWYGFVTLQEGHGSVDKVSQYWLRQYQASPPKPLLEGEANYEALFGSIPTWMSRESVWKAHVGGAFGNTYGAAGVWWACWDRNDPSENCHLYGNTPWYEGLFLPGAAQMGLLKAFFTSLPWWRLTPAPGIVNWSAEAPTDTQAPFAAATPNHRIVVVYYPHRLDGGGVYTGAIYSLPRGDYTLRWYNPQNGYYGSVSRRVVTTPGAAVVLPQQPSASSDWTLLIRMGK